MKTKIRELRKARKLSQEELAEAVGTTRQTITSIEVGKYTASLPLAYKIARYFGLTIEEVFDFSDRNGMKERIIDVTGTPLTPSRHGKKVHRKW